jgi:TRAP-type mannitol/chloroaromatic compound transport system permease small subunit
LLVALAYLGAAYTETEDGHVRMDLLYARLSGKRKAIADILINMIAMCWVGMLFWQGGRIVLHSFLARARSSDAMMWPLWPSQLMIPIGTLLLGVVLICKLLFAVSVLIERE